MKLLHVHQKIVKLDYIYVDYYNKLFLWYGGGCHVTHVIILNAICHVSHTRRQLPSSASSTILESLLSLSSSGNAILFVQSMRTISSLFRIDFNQLESKQQTRVMDLCDRIIDVLYAMKPHAADVNATIAYLKCVVSAFTYMSKHKEWMRVSDKLPIWMQLLATNLISQDVNHTAKPQVDHISPPIPIPIIHPIISSSTYDMTLSPCVPIFSVLRTEG